eukprot:4597209-Pleurochrysis_carterae.AAC.1
MGEGRCNAAFGGIRYVRYAPLAWSLAVHQTASSPHVCRICVRAHIVLSESACDAEGCVALFRVGDVDLGDAGREERLWTSVNRQRPRTALRVPPAHSLPAARAWRRSGR